jgi:SAM-dependent methyltransferase
MIKAEARRQAVMSDALSQYRSVWERKPVLRAVYQDMFERIMASLGPGPTLDVGAGIGKLKQRLPDLIASDIQYSPWLDLVADAQSLPFADGSLGNIVMIDVLHHVEFPISFLRAAGAALRSGGRIVMVEPAITWGSTLFYRFVHQEPVIMSADLFVEGCPDPDRDPYDANQAIPTLLVRHRERFHRLVPNLKIVGVSWFAFAVYPMSGGFQPWSLLTETMAQWGLSVEHRLEATLGRLLGFRMLMIVEKN